MPQSKPMMWFKFLMYMSVMMLMLTTKLLYNTNNMKKKYSPNPHKYITMKW